jgi:hypothetical protein
MNVQDAGPVGTFVRCGSNFSHAVMIEHTRARPEFLQSRTRRRNAAAGFTRDEQKLHRRLSERNVFRRGDFSQAHRVAGRAAKNGRLRIENRAEPRAAAHSAPPGKQRAPRRAADSNAGPKAEEGPEGKREEHTVGAREVRGAINLLPVAQHPIPVLGVSSQRNGAPLVPLV